MSVWVNIWPSYTNLIADSSRADFAQPSEAFLVPFICLLGLTLSGAQGLRALAVRTPYRFMHGYGCRRNAGRMAVRVFSWDHPAPTYFATSENRWEEVLFQYIPEWSIVADRQATTGFYEIYIPYFRIPTYSPALAES